jgi:hypothetical protein
MPSWNVSTFIPAKLFSYMAAREFGREGTSLITYCINIRRGIRVRTQTTPV